MARKQWSRSDLDFFVKSASQYTAAELSMKLGRCKCSIRTKAEYFGIKLMIVRPNNDWSQKEINHFTTHSDKEIISITGRSLQSVATKRRRMNIYRRAI